MTEITEQLVFIPFLLFWYLAILTTCAILLVMFISTFFPDCCVRSHPEDHTYLLVPTGETDMV